MEPGTFLAIRSAVTKVPKMVSQVVGTLKEPMETMEAGSAMMMPPPCRPTKEMKIPMPAAMAYFKSSGMASMMISRMRNRETMVNKMEATKTPAMASSQGTPITKTTE